MKWWLLILSLIGTQAWAAPANFDLRERIQFILTGNQNKEVRFEYCKLADCKSLVDRSFSTAELESIIGQSLLPTGLALQIVTDAGVNRVIKPSIEYSVGGLVQADQKHFAICRDKEILEQLKTKKKPEDFIIKFDISRCPQVTKGPTTSVKSEANLLKSALEAVEAH
ncbi:hypothetical protein D3C72_1242380 [compost metagenome]